MTSTVSTGRRPRGSQPRGRGTLLHVAQGLGAAGCEAGRASSPARPRTPHFQRGPGPAHAVAPTHLRRCPRRHAHARGRLAVFTCVAFEDLRDDDGDSVLRTSLEDSSGQW